MSVLVPGALGLLALAGPLLVLYMLRSKRRRMVVPSTMPWERVGDSVSSAVPWQPLRWTALLLIQLLVLALFALSLARPFTSERALLGPHTVMVVDTSGSMSTGGRLEAAVARASALAGDVSASNLVSVVSAGPNPEVLAAFARTPGAVREALAAIVPSGGPARLDDAIALARGLATPDRPTSLLIFSDGDGQPLASEPVVDATHLVFDDTGPDVSLDAFGPDVSTEGVTRGFLSVSSHGGTESTVRIDLAVDGLPAGSVDVSVPGAGSGSAVTPIDAEPGDLVSARIGSVDGRPIDEAPDANPSNANPLNDAAWFVLGSGPDRSVSILGDGSPFLSALVDVTPGFTLGSERPDVLIVDGGPLPDIDRPAWIIRAETPPEGVRLAAVARNVAVTSQRPGEPILDGVDMSTLAVAEAQVVETVSWVPIVSAGDVPLLLLGEVDGHRAVYTSFDLTHSNFPVQVTFPVVGSRILQWLTGASTGAVSGGVAGDPIAVDPPAGVTTLVTLPDGTTRELPPTAGSFRDTDRPGVYQVAYRASDGTLEPGPIAVRSFDPTESGAVPRSIAVTTLTSGVAPETSLVREAAPWAIGATLLLISLEWWVGHQRPSLRRRVARA